MIIISDNGGRIFVDSITIMFRGHYYYYENHISGPLQTVSCVLKGSGWLFLGRHYFETLDTVTCR